MKDSDNDAENKILQFILKVDDHRITTLTQELNAVVSLAVKGKIDPNYVGVDNLVPLLQKAKAIGLTNGKGEVFNKSTREAIDNFLKNGTSKDKVFYNDESIRLPEGFAKLLNSKTRTLYFAALDKANEGAHL